MRFVALMLFFCSVVAGACTRYVPPKYDLESYPHTYRSYDVMIYWKVESSSDAVEIQGLVTNIRNIQNYDMRYFEMTIRALDASDNRIVHKTIRSHPDVLKPGDIIPFTVSLNLPAGAKPVKLSFYYEYDSTEVNLTSGEHIFGNFEEKLIVKQ